MGKKQWTSGPKGRTFDAITQRSKGYLVRPGINQRIFQKVADVRYFCAYVCYTIHKVQCTNC
jgi:hypothetical protein